MFVATYLWMVVLAAGVSCVPVSTVPEGELLQPKISYSRETVAKPGEDVLIDCAVEGIDLSGVQDFGVSWSKIDLEKPTNSYPISSGETVVLFTSKYQVVHPENTYQYSLKILNIEEEDTGTYRCTVNFGSDQKINAEVPVLIEKSPYFVDPSTKTLTVSEGDAISIDCQPGGSPKPTVFWERVNQELPFYGGNFFKDNQLDIPYVEPSHEGRYVCHADNGLGDPAKSEVILSVQYPPKVHLSSGVVGATIREKVSVLCTVDAHPAAEVSWYKGDDIILGSVNTRVSTQFKDKKVQHNLVGDDLKPPTPRIVISTLTIEKVTVDELGRYSCRATNTIGAANSSVQITLKTPPKIEVQSARRIFYNGDSDKYGRSNLPVSVECKASGIPAPEYRWTKNNEVLIWQSNPRMSLEPSTGTLLIEEPTVADNGWYQCVAYNELGVAKSDPVYVLNATRVTFDPLAKAFIELTAEEGRPFSMVCPNATGDPKPEITWAIAEKPSIEGQTRMQFFSSNRTVVGPDGTAYFTHIIKEDDSDVSGISYICLGANKASPQDLSLGTTVKLKVIAPKDGAENGQLSNLNIEPFLMYGSPERVVLKGSQENKLWCIFGGEPVPTITWERMDGKPITGSEYALDNYNSTLVILDTNLTHATGHRCIANNNVGPPSVHTTAVMVDMPPTFREAMKSTTVEGGSTVTFSCDAQGSGVLTFNWYFNGRVILPTEGSRRTVKGNTLTIDRVTVTDIGNYACNATSLSGYAYGQATLNVLPIEGSPVSGFSCPEVTSLRNELVTVKESLHKLRDFVQNTRTAQADASINLIQRIAAKLNILTQEEQELLAAQTYLKRNQEEIEIQADLQKKANNRDELLPNVLYAENKNKHRNEAVKEDSDEKADEIASEVVDAEVVQTKDGTAAEEDDAEVVDAEVVQAKDGTAAEEDDAEVVDAEVVQTKDGTAAEEDDAEVVDAEVVQTKDGTAAEVDDGEVVQTKDGVAAEKDDDSEAASVESSTTHEKSVPTKKTETVPSADEQDEEAVPVEKGDVITVEGEVTRPEAEQEEEEEEQQQQVVKVSEKAVQSDVETAPEQEKEEVLPAETEDEASIPDAEQKQVPKNPGEEEES